MKRQEDRFFSSVIRTQSLFILNGGGAPRQTSLRQRSQATLKKNIKLKRDLQFMNISKSHTHTFFGSTMIFIQHEGPLNWACLTQANGQDPNHGGPSPYCWTTSINSMAWSTRRPTGQLGMTNMLARPDLFLPKTGGKIYQSSGCGWHILPAVQNHGRWREVGSQRYLLT